MTTPEILTASGPHDLLAMLPGLVGFAPRNSIVLIAFRGRRTCGAMRVDLPVSDNATVQKRIATHLIGMICKLPSVDAIIPVVVTDDRFDGGEAIPHAGLLAILNGRIRQSGFELRESLCLAADGWGSLLDPFPREGGHPLSDIADSPLSAALAEHVRPGFADQKLPEADPAKFDRMRKRLAEYARLQAASERGDRDDAPCAIDVIADIPYLAESALHWSDDEIDDFGAILAFALQPPPVRDHVMLQWATTPALGDEMWSELESGRLDRSVRLDGCWRLEASGVDVGDLMLGIGPSPDPRRMEAGISLLRTIVSRLSDEHRPPLLCMLVWLTWSLGRGSAAGRYLDEAVGINPEYGMTGVLATMLSNGRMPEWAFLGRQHLSPADGATPSPAEPGRSNTCRRR